jgi:5'-methylthioadenosine phosphorylase
MAAIPNDVLVGVIGGSGMYDMPGIEGLEAISIETPYGTPSDAYKVGTLNGVKVAFLSRHAPGHKLMPSELPARANVWGFKKLGVKWLISVSACGSLRQEYAPGQLVIPEGLFDRTSGRELSFFGEGCVAHTSLADPYCKVLMKVLADAARTTDKVVHEGGNLVSINGPRFSTRCESNVFRQWGLDLINMTTVPECQLATEAEIAYAVLNCVTDYDCWHEGEEDVTVEMVIKTLMGNVAAAQVAVADAVQRLAAGGLESDKWNALAGGIMTNKDIVPAATQEKLALICEKYWA